MSMRRRGPFWREDRGSTAIEYALIALVVSVSIVPILSAMLPNLSAIFSSFVGPLN